MNPDPKKASLFSRIMLAIMYLFLAGLGISVILVLFVLGTCFLG